MLWVAVLVSVVSLLSLACVAAEEKTFEHCVVGAGPGGLQAGVLLAERGVSYVILEKEERAGAFFRTWPVLRQLYSRHPQHDVVAELDNPSGRLRFDELSLIHWNGTAGSVYNFSTVVRAEDALTGTYDVHPHADDYARYLEGVAASLHVVYDTEVTATDTSDARVVRLETTGGRYACGAVWAATGLVPPAGVEDPTGLVAGCHTVDARAGAYTNRSVAVIGSSQEAFAVGSRIALDAGRVMLLQGYSMRFSFFTGLKGDAGMSPLMEHYQLKSLDILDHVSAEHLAFAADPGPGKRVSVEANGTALFTADVVLDCRRHAFDGGWMGDAAPETWEGFPKIALTGVCPADHRIMFAGVLMHGAHVAAGNTWSVGGFRHMIRASMMWRELALTQELREGTRIPLDLAPLDDIWALLVDNAVARVTVAGGLYQVPVHLVDVLVMDPEAATWVYAREVSTTTVQMLAAMQPRLSLMTTGFMQAYPSETSSGCAAYTDPEQDGHPACAAELHPVLSFYTRRLVLAHRLDLPADPTRRWGLAEDRVAIAAWMQRVRDTWEGEVAPRWEAPACPANSGVRLMQKEPFTANLDDVMNTGKITAGFTDSNEMAVRVDKPDGWLW